MNREEKKPNLINDIVASWVYDIIKNNQKSSVEEIDNDKLILKDNSDEVQDINDILTRVKANTKHKPDVDEIDLNTVFDDPPIIEENTNTNTFKSKNKKIGVKPDNMSFNIDYDFQQNEDINEFNIGGEVDSLEEQDNKIKIIDVEVKKNIEERQEQSEYNYPLIKLGYFNTVYQYLLFDKEKDYKTFNPLCGFYSFIFNLTKIENNYLTGKIEVFENMFTGKNKKIPKLTGTYNLYIENAHNMMFNENDILYVGILFLYKQNFSVTQKDKLLLESYFSYFSNLTDRQLIAQKEVGLSKLTKKELVPNIVMLTKENYLELFGMDDNIN